MHPNLWRALALVATGAALGAAARAGLTSLLGATHTVSGLWSILGINLCGAFCLGILYSWAGDRHPQLYLAAGTGVLGGFTTYSTFAVDMATAVQGSFLGLSPVAVTLVATLLFGPVAALVGMALGEKLSALRAPSLMRPSPDSAKEDPSW